MENAIGIRNRIDKYHLNSSQSGLRLSHTNTIAKGMKRFFF